MVLASIRLNAVVAGHYISVSVGLNSITIEFINLGEMLQPAISHIPQDIDVIIDDTVTMRLWAGDVVLDHLEFALGVTILFLVDFNNREISARHSHIDILIVPDRFISTRASVNFLQYCWVQINEHFWLV